MFLRMRETEILYITDPRMTRFWITLGEGVNFTIQSLERMQGPENFVPKIRSMNIMDLARAIGPDCETKIVGVRPGEKLHEVMVPQDDARHTVEYDQYYAIMPSFHEWTAEEVRVNGGQPCLDGFCYSSDSNDRWLTTEELRQCIGLDAAESVER